MINPYQARVNECTNLNELCNTLNHLTIKFMKMSIEQEFALNLEHYVDIAGLPTFGHSPSDTAGIISWDETRLLVPANFGGYEVVLRDEDED